LERKKRSGSKSKSNSRENKRGFDKKPKPGFDDRTYNQDKESDSRRNDGHKEFKDAKKIQQIS